MGQEISLVVQSAQLNFLAQNLPITQTLFERLVHALLDTVITKDQVFLLHIN